MNRYCFSDVVTRASCTVCNLALQISHICSLYCKVSKLSCSLANSLLVVLLLNPASGNAVPNLILDPAPVTWNIIGLDHNNVNVGPQDFPVGIRVLNTGTMDALNVTGVFEFTSANPYISLLHSDTVTTTVIPAGGLRGFLLHRACRTRR